MIFKEYRNEEDFLNDNEANLLLAEDINNTILGIIPQTEKEKVFFRIENEDKIEMIGLITKSERKGLLVYIENLIISVDVCEFLVDEIIKRDIDLREINAPKGIAEIILDLYSQKKKVELRSNKQFYLMKLKKLNEQYDNDGIIRKAEIGDLEFEKGMVLDISSETLGQPCTEERAYEIAKVYIDKGLYFLVDENGEILSQAATTKAFKNGYTIGAVFTPQDKRRKGFARLCLYKVIKQILEENKQIVVLYSNVEKPQNRALYESLGFEIILENTVIKF